jgi:hypothetical protein
LGAVLILIAASFLVHFSNIAEDDVILFFELFLEVLGESFVSNASNRKTVRVNSLIDYLIFE